MFFPYFEPFSLRHFPSPLLFYFFSAACSLSVPLFVFDTRSPPGRLSDLSLRNKQKNKKQKKIGISLCSYVPLNREQRERGAALLKDAAERGWLLSTVDPDSIRPLEDDEFKLVSRY